MDENLVEVTNVAEASGLNDEPLMLRTENLVKNTGRVQWWIMFPLMCNEERLSGCWDQTVPVKPLLLYDSGVNCPK